jgi:site-specific DNA-methyltransferase (adenine-specific)
VPGLRVWNSGGFAELGGVQEVREAGETGGEEVNRYQTDLLDLRQGDCMDLMRETPDGWFDLALVDPPYAWNSGNAFRSRLKRYGTLEFNETRPSPLYFKELRRVSKHQIIWGGNYFVSDLHDSKCWIVWDKHQPVETYARIELAWTSLGDRHARLADLPYFGATGREVGRCHPNQKPVALYRWLLANYAKPGQRILDTHLGSGSHAIACHYAGLHLTATELDPDYFQASVERIKRETAQQTLFQPEQITPKQEPLFP